ncbi:MAG: sigma-70 family RNA polymerase sigma factor [Planctomycetota bacterium]
MPPESAPAFTPDTPPAGSPGNPDARLIQRAQRGSRAARAELLRMYQDVWYRFCLHQLRLDDAARDATQEIALRFLDRLADFRGESRLRTWSLGIALNVCREWRRESGRSPDPLRLRLADDPPAPDATAERSERFGRLSDRIDALPDRQREAVTLRYLHELSVAETAEAMGCAAGTVKATLSQALRRLRREMTEVTV